MNDVLKLTDIDQPDDRFSRFQLIGWWDQQKLSDSKALVIGAGAIGNELIKNLALLGVGHLFVADLDNIENSNLSRSVLYRAADCGHSKAEVAAERARTIYPDMQTNFFHGNIVYDLGLGVYRWADVILGGLDNREARVAINQSAARVGKPWIDGAIERLEGVARVFNAATGPCYECTMNEVDWKMLESRRSCALLTRDEMEQGKVPTTPTTSSVIAGIQVQEAVKMIHGLNSLEGQGFVFDGTCHQSYLVKYSRLEDCPVHEICEPIIELSTGSDIQAGTFLERIQSELGPEAVVDFNQDLIQSFTCHSCQETEPCFASLGQVTERNAICPGCGDLRAPDFYHSLDAQSEFLDRTLHELGVPRWDILTGRKGMEQKFYELSGDRQQVLGALESGNQTS